MTNTASISSALMLACALPSVASAEDSMATTVKAQWESRSARPGNPLGLQDQFRSLQTADMRWQYELARQGTLRGVMSGRHVSGAGYTLRIAELSLDRPVGEGFVTFGKKVMSWDVGYAFRPLDVVQQEDRRALNPTTQEGVPMLAWEAFDADRAVTVVWSNPGKGLSGQPRDDGAIAVRLYRQRGARDEYVVLRASRRNGLEAGASFSHIASDAMEVHASLLWQQRHDEWLALPRAIPHWERRQGGGKALAGMTWTTESKLSILGEAWIDRSVAKGQQQNLLLRASQSAGNLEVAADLLWQPQNDSRIGTVAAGWKQGPWLLTASLRHYSGVAGTLTRSLASVSVQRGF